MNLLNYYNQKAEIAQEVAEGYSVETAVSKMRDLNERAKVAGLPVELFDEQAFREAFEVVQDEEYESSYEYSSSYC